MDTILKHALENDLYGAVARQELRLHYQPVVDGQRRIVGMEALLRWQHPTLGMVAPADFIALAERSGLILPIGWWVLETACAQLAKWSRSPQSAHWELNINISARQLNEPGFVERTLELLQRSGANPRQLCLELTETILLTGIDQRFLDGIGWLKTHGVQLALDDFGTGYSSLSYLRQLPLDRVKIDRTFVLALLDSPKDRSIATAILALAKDLGLHVIAEGVETPEQFEFLRAAGCPAFQGYLFGRPESIETLQRQG